MIATYRDKFVVHQMDRQFIKESASIDGGSQMLDSFIVARPIQGHVSQFDA
jgi:hypothetical protein